MKKIFIPAILLIFSGVMYFSYISISNPINSNTCDYRYEAEPEGVFMCDIDNSLVFVYTPEKKVEIINKVDGQVLNTFYPYDYDSDNSNLTFEDSLNDFEFIDINSDGIRDLQVKNFSGAYNMVYSFYIYDIQDGKYILEPNLKEITNASFKEINSEGFVFEYSKGRGIGDIYSTSDFKYNRDTLRYEKVKICIRDFLGEDFSEEDGYYYYCETSNNKNEWRLSTLTFDGVGNENIRSCPSYSCSIIKYGTLKPEIEFIKKQGDWYEVNYIEKGELAEEKWTKTKGWMHKSNVPKEVQDLINSEKV